MAEQVTLHFDAAPIAEPAKLLKPLSNPSPPLLPSEQKQKPEQKQQPQQQQKPFDYKNISVRERTWLLDLETEFMESDKPLDQYSEAQMKDFRRGSILRIYGTLDSE
ncbi:MAG: hypothetical protein M1829_002702 [Trizodia sp. TS-e1964]|nr:MAG: hypothetical protein M1829_002702 [Trizodia sp. TS-e1964]